MYVCLILCVQNLEESIDSGILHQYFCEFGVVLSSKVELDPIGRSTGRGYIQFQDEEEAQRAIEKMNNRMLRGKQVCVEPFMRRTDYWEAGNKNRIELNPAHSPPGTLSQVMKNGIGSHAIQFGSFECAIGPHDIAAADAAVSFQSSVSAARASTSNVRFSANCSLN
jgi:RNA recognition motif-containing protein